MTAFWYKEWREFAQNGRTLLGRLLLPLLLTGPLLEVPALRLPALFAAIGYFGTYQTAVQVARERISGFLPRLALTPVNPTWLVLQRILARSLLLLVQLGPVLALADLLSGASGVGGPPGGPGLLPLALPLVPTSCALGAYLGLQAPTRRWAVLTGLLAVAGAAGLSRLVPDPATWSSSRVATPLVRMATLVPDYPPALALWALAVLLSAAALQAAPRIFCVRSE